MPPSHSEKISERAQHLLKALVKRYIRDGQPVGSRTLSRDANLDLSAAATGGFSYFITRCESRLKCGHHS